jgi:uncharacterized DUF497 family protein
VKYNWNDEKNEWLLKNRGVSFEMLLEYGVLLNVVQNNSMNHKDQLEFHYLYEGSVYRVPFVFESKDSVFLKTAHKSSKLNKIYKRRD